MLKYRDGYYVLIAVNMTKQTLNAVIQLPVSIAPSNGVVDRLFEGTTTNVMAGGITDTFGEFGVHVYKFAAPSSGSGGRQAVTERANNPEESEFMVDVYPNPSGGDVTFSVNGGQYQDVSVQISDMQGKSIRSIFYNAAESRAPLVTWDGFDTNHKRVVRGLYYYTVYSNGQVLKRGKLAME